MADIANLEDVTHDLIENQIPFCIHYPSEESAVITVSDHSTNEALQLLVAAGASIGPDGKLLILFT